MANSRGFLLK